MQARSVLVRETWLMAASLLLACLLCTGLSSCRNGGGTRTKREVQRQTDRIRQNTYILRQHVEHWAEQHGGLYPDDAMQLLAELDPQEIPRNPLSEGPVQALWIDARLDEKPGNFCYIPVYDEDHASGYYLLGFGEELAGSEDVDDNGEVDGVMLVLQPEGAIQPSLGDVLSGKRGARPALYKALDSIAAELAIIGEHAADDNGRVYPESLAGEEPVLPLPANPYTGEMMRQVAVRDETRSGNFSYVPFSLHGLVRGYYLVGYGRPETAGLDVDGDGVADNAVRVLQAGPDEMPVLHVLLGQNDDGQSVDEPEDGTADGEPAAGDSGAG